MVEKFNTQHTNTVKVFKSTNVNMLSFSNVQENTIDEKQESLNIEMLAPWKAQIEEKLT